jgi:hypothetical protein
MLRDLAGESHPAGFCRKQAAATPGDVGDLLPDDEVEIQ